MEDAQLLDGQHSLHYLLEQELGARLGQPAPARLVRYLGDVVEQVLAALEPLHHDNEAVSLLQIVEYFDAAFDMAHADHQRDLQRYSPGEQSVLACLVHLVDEVVAQ
ncbi:hypothetical protein BpHYR1_015701, partial [Brachionus plicatilis]